jgi:HEAT repeat protein
VELISRLRDFPSQAAADVCVAALQDKSSLVRHTALVCLRLFSRKVDMMAGERVQRGPRMPAKVDGLVPHLLKAADDPDPGNRGFFLYCLADTLDPDVVPRLRAALKDPDARVRLDAAYLLTEFNDASGLPEMGLALNRVRAQIKAKDDMRFMEAGRLIASFTRVTGKSFGRPPGNPILSSDTRQAADLADENDRLIEKWGEWWDAQPR